MARRRRAPDWRSAETCTAQSPDQHSRNPTEIPDESSFWLAFAKSSGDYFERNGDFSRISGKEPTYIMPVDLSRLDLIDQLLEPIQKLIRTILPNFVEKDLKDPEVREMVAAAVDKALVAQFPAAGFIPADLRQSIIRKQLDLIIDDIVLGAG
jgi:hypothetical protein